MIDTIGYTAAYVMGVSILALMASLIGAVDRVNKFRHDIDKIDHDKVANVCWAVLKASTVTAVLSWITIVVVAIIDSITR